MSRSTHIGQEGSVEASYENELEAAVVDEVAERERRLAPSVEQEGQSRIDYADDREHDGRLFGQTLAAEERMRAREWEIERTRTRWDRSTASDREARCRAAVREVGTERRRAFAERRASIDPWADPGRPDAREQLARDELAAVHREAARLSERLDGFATAAIARQLARRVVDGADVRDAALSTFEALRTAPGQVIPIAAVEEVPRREVDLEGEVATLWEPSHPSIQQVGLLEDGTGRIKFTVWRKSRQPMVREGERVRFRSAAKNWYRGRVSVALTGWSRIVRSV